MSEPIARGFSIGAAPAALRSGWRRILAVRIWIAERLRPSEWQSTLLWAALAGSCSRICTRTHDYTRHGTVTLFATLNYLDGKILSTTATKHTHVEWLAFLKQLHRQTPAELALHLIVDNYSTHKHPVVRAWLEKHPRVHLHFTPTGSSWLNLVERFFRQLTDDVVREGSFASVGELVTAINVHLAHHNLSPKPYRWKAQGAAILEKIQRARAAQAKTVL